MAASYSNLGNVYYRIGEYNHAKELFEKALMIRKKIFGEEHASVVTSYDKLKRVCNKIGEYNQANEVQKKALRNKDLEKKNYLSRRTVAGHRHNCVLV